MSKDAQPPTTAAAGSGPAIGASKDVTTHTTPTPDKKAQLSPSRAVTMSSVSPLLLVVDLDQTLVHSNGLKAYLRYIHLEKLAKRYTLCICTHGRADYAGAVRNIMDSTGELFGKRVYSIEFFNGGQKQLDLLIEDLNKRRDLSQAPFSRKRTIILDDFPDAWAIADRYYIYNVIRFEHWAAVIDSVGISATQRLLEIADAFDSATMEYMLYSLSHSRKALIQDTGSGAVSTAPSSSSSSSSSPHSPSLTPVSSSSLSSPLQGPAKAAAPKSSSPEMKSTATPTNNKMIRAPELRDFVMRFKINVFAGMRITFLTINKKADAKRIDQWSRLAVAHGAVYVPDLDESSTHVVVLELNEVCHAEVQKASKSGKHTFVTPAWFLACIYHYTRIPKPTHPSMVQLEPRIYDWDEANYEALTYIPIPEADRVKAKRVYTLAELRGKYREQPFPKSPIEYPIRPEHDVPRADSAGVAKNHQQAPKQEGNLSGIKRCLSAIYAASSSSSSSSSENTDSTKQPTKKQRLEDPEAAFTLS